MLQNYYIFELWRFHGEKRYTNIWLFIWL